jgi:hypothetical protein
MLIFIKFNKYHPNITISKRIQQNNPLFDYYYLQTILIMPVKAMI